MKKVWIVTTLLLLGSTQAVAKDFDANGFVQDLNYGAGIGFIDLGLDSSALLFYGIAEKSLPKVKLADFDSVAQLRLGTSTTASTSTPLFNAESKIDYLISGLFKSSKELDKALSAYGMAGFTYSSVSVTVPAVFFLGTQVSPQTTRSTTSFDLTLGIGVDYKLNRDLTLGVEYADYGSGTVFAANAYYNF